MPPMRCLPSLLSIHICCAFAGLVGGCQWYVDSADREVYRLIEERQQQSLGEARKAPIDHEKVPLSVDPEAYAFVPHPTDSDVPASFKSAATQPASAASQPDGLSSTKPAPAFNGASTQPAERAMAFNPVTSQP